MCRVSVLVPVYNVKKYLRQCLDSLAAQTLDGIEFICIDDGSTDGCSEILDAYAEKDERFRVIHKENSGYGASMNVGLRAARGEYIGIVESDDWIAPTMYEELYKNAMPHFMMLQNCRMQKSCGRISGILQRQDPHSMRHYRGIHMSRFSARWSAIQNCC